MPRLPSRQVHLDFHTSEHIPGVGRDFSKKQFQEALKVGRVNSITVFAKCHHGWCYYPSEQGYVHPSLERDLLGEMIEAAHEIGVQAPIYMTVGFSSSDLVRHPEWVALDQEQKPQVTNIPFLNTAPYDFEAADDDPLPISAWKYLCVATEYGQHIKDLTEEICQRYPVDGFFYDINFGRPCFCTVCQTLMEEEGLHPQLESDLMLFRQQKWLAFMECCNAVIHQHHPQARSFYNGPAYTMEHFRDAGQTHFELEDLPTAMGGYDKMAARAKITAQKGKDYLGMTGKFHTVWGEFGGFKHPHALRYECAAMMAWGARCSVGDQLHPSGLMDMESYRLIGHAYDYAADIEPWCFEARAFSNLGLCLSGQPESDDGLVQMLLEAHIDFDVVTAEKDFSQFDTVVVAEDKELNDEEINALKAFQKIGGAVLFLGSSVWDQQHNQAVLDAGVVFEGPSSFDCDYIKWQGQAGKALCDSPFLCYQPAFQFKNIDAEVLACTHQPYFSRTYGKYCSHQNTPYQKEASPFVAASKKGQVLLLAHPLGRMYAEHGMRLHRDYFVRALGLIHRSIIEVELPSAGRINLMRQEEQKRWVLHLLYGPPLKRGRVQVIEDLPPLFDVEVTFYMQQSISTVTLEPQNQDLDFSHEAGVLKVTVPRLQGHQMVVFA